MIMEIYHYQLFFIYMPTTLFTSIIKRDGSEAVFQQEKITMALARAGNATHEFDEKEAQVLSDSVITLALKKCDANALRVEDIQDIVEQVLMRSRFKKTAKAYILYRAQHAEMRAFATAANLGLIDSYLDKLDWQVKLSMIGP